MKRYIERGYTLNMLTLVMHFILSVTPQEISGGGGGGGEHPPDPLHLAGFIVHVSLLTCTSAPIPKHVHLATWGRLSLVHETS